MKVKLKLEIEMNMKTGNDNYMEILSKLLKNPCAGVLKGPRPGPRNWSRDRTRAQGLRQFWSPGLGLGPSRATPARLLKKIAGTFIEFLYVSHVLAKVLKRMTSIHIPRYTARSYQLALVFEVSQTIEVVLRMI